VAIAAGMHQDKHRDSTIDNASAQNSARRSSTRPDAAIADPDLVRSYG